jgi:hypothetical protein
MIAFSFIRCHERRFEGLLFANLIEFDMIQGIEMMQKDMQVL